MRRARLSPISLALIAAMTAALLGLGQGSALAAPVPVADYRFLNTRTTSIGSAPALVDEIGCSSSLGCTSSPTNGPNVFAKQTVDGRLVPVLTFPLDNGLRLSPTTSILSSNGTYTIVMLFKLDVTSGYKRLIEFKNGTADQGPYAQSGHLNFYPMASGPTIFAAGTYVQVALTRSAASKTVVGYLNGVQQFSFTDTSDYGLIGAGNVLRFFRDNVSGGVVGEEASGAVARIRIYNMVLTSTQVAALDRLPPKPKLTLVPTSGPPSTSVTVTGSNFGPNETVKVSFIDPIGGVTTSLGSATTNAAGSFTKVVSVPAGATTGCPLPGCAEKFKGKGVTSTLVASKTFYVT